MRKITCEEAVCAKVNSIRNPDGILKAKLIPLQQET
jgi:hypothetical protein